MKEFDLELAKAGHPVCTRDGKPVRIICFDVKGTDYPIVAAIMAGDVEYINQYPNSGKYYADSHESPGDLMMASEVKDGDDKRIKEAISYAIANSTHEDGILLNGVTESEAIAWLKKQGEYNLIENYPIFRVGDCIRNKKTNDKVLIEQLDIATKTYWHVSYDGAAVNHSDFPFSQQNEWELIEQKIVEPKFKVGDWVIDKKGSIDQITNVIENVTNHTYGYDTINGEYFNDYTEGIRLWTIQDAKDGDVLTTDTWTFIFKKYQDKSVCYHCAVSTFNNFSISDTGEFDSNYVHPTTKEQRDLLFQKMKEAGYEWGAEKKELEKIDSYCQKNCKGYQETGRCFADGECQAKKDAESTWSEEDEKMLRAICTYMLDYPRLAKISDKKRFNEYCDWIKSLKDRFQQ